MELPEKNPVSKIRMIKSVATKRNLYGTTWNISKKNINNIRTCWKNSTIPNFLVKDSSGMRPQVVNLLFLFSRKLWTTWKAQRNSTISAAPEEEQSVLDVRRPQSHRSRDRIRAMTLRLLGKFFMILLLSTGLSSLSQVLCWSWRRL